VLTPLLMTRASVASNVDDEKRLLAAAIELLSQLDRDDTLESAAHTLAHRLTETAECRDVVVFWRHKPTVAMDVMASTNSQVDPMLMAATEEFALRRKLTTWPRSTPDLPADQGGMLAIVQAARATNATRIIGSCLFDDEHNVVGLIVMLDPTSPHAAAFLEAMSAPLSSKLTAIQRHQPTTTQAVIHGLVQSLPTRKRTLIIAIVATTLLMLAPATYTVDAKLEMQPTRRRFVAAAVDGPLQSCHVRPGDQVVAEELLAEIDPREIEYELAGLQSQLEQAIQTEKTHLAAQEFAAGQLARLETEQLRGKTELLAHRREHLEIRSPIDGVIVSGDWRSREGTPLSRGETLFEIAPLAKMKAEIWVPESEYPHVRKGMQVRFYTLAAPNQIVNGSITKVHPKAELHDHENVFIADVFVDNKAGLLKPGMRGWATIYSDTHSIGWNLLHRPWYAFRNFVGF
jgi:multidrug resistance efflux pump